MLNLGDLLYTLIDPTTNGQQTSSRFGYAVAADGNLAVVAAPFLTVGAVQFSGRAYVFNSTTGALVATLNNPVPARANFGYSVAVSGTTAVVGTPWGAAYIFDATTGDLLRTLNNPAPQGYDYFGSSVAVSGNTVIVGQPYNPYGPGPTHWSGSAYVFDAATGNLLWTLNDPRQRAGDLFGWSVAVSGSTIVVGAVHDSAGAAAAGAAYVFDAATGSLLWTLANPVPTYHDYFGCSVAVSGSTVVVSASRSAYLFDAVTGNLLHDLGTPAPRDDWWQNAFVGISDNTVAVGAGGAVHILDAATGNSLRTLSNAGFFGYSVAVSQRAVVVGAPYDSAGARDAGAAYLFDAGRTTGAIIGSTWYDADTDGVWDTPREPALAVWTIYLDANGNGQLDPGEPTQVTDTSGRYVFGNLAAGTYTVREVLQPNWTQTSPAAGAYTVVLAAGQTVANQDFGNYASPGRIEGDKWSDVDGDGIRDSGEPTLPAWTIYLDTNGNGQCDPGEPVEFTDGAGHYVFRDLVPGTYTVREVLRSGWAQTFPAGGAYSVILSPGQVVAGKDFGNHLPPPAGVDLLAASDTGVSSTDNLTRLDNSGSATRLQFGVSGTIAGATVTVYADGTAIGSATATGTTTTITTNGARDLADGSRSITARQTWPGNPESPDSPALAIAVDTLAPAYPSAPDLQTASDSGVSQTDNVTNDATPTFTVSAGTYFRFYRDGVRISGDYQSGTSYTPAVQSDGSYNYQASAVDPAGNESALSSALSVTIDTVAPTASITPVSPDPRYAWVFNVDFAFSERAFNVALSKLSLSRDGGGNLLGVGQTVTSPTGDNIRFRLAGLAPVTTAPGHYVLTLAGAGSGISDRAGNLLVAGAVEDWTTRPTVFDGTSGDDRFVFSSDGTNHTLTVTLAGGSPAQYVYPASNQVTLTLNGMDGNDQIAVFGGPGAETATISRYTVDVTGPGYHIIGSSLETISVDARAGSGQTASLFDGPADDVFTASAGFRTGSMVGTGAGNVYRNSVKNFDTIFGYATGGGAGDKAYLYDSNGNDSFESQAGLATDPHSFIQRVSGGTGPAAYVYAGAGFENVWGMATAGGVDEAVLFGSNGDDSMRFEPGYTSGSLIFTRAYITRPGAYFIYAQNFKKVTGYAQDGNDAAAFFDTAQSDVFTASPTDARLTGPAGSNLLNIAVGFDTVRAYSQVGGYDKAYLTGSTGDDSFRAYAKPRTVYPGMGRLTGTGYFLEVYHFEEVYADLNGGNDTANLYDGTANDYFWAKLGAAVLTDGTVSDATGDLVTPNTYYYKVYGFNSAAGDHVNLWGTSGGTNTKRVIAPLDYVLAAYGTWTDAP